MADQDVPNIEVIEDATDDAPIATPRRSPRAVLTVVAVVLVIGALWVQALSSFRTSNESRRQMCAYEVSIREQLATQELTGSFDFDDVDEEELEAIRAQQYEDLESCGIDVGDITSTTERTTTTAPERTEVSTGG